MTNISNNQEGMNLNEAFGGGVSHGLENLGVLLANICIIQRYSQQNVSARGWGLRKRNLIKICAKIPIVINFANKINVNICKE